MKDLLSIPGKVTETYLQLPLRLDYNEWSDVGKKLSRFKNWAQFALGDWLSYGELNFGEDYAQAASELGISPETLSRYKYIAWKVKPLIRRKELTWAHHREVSGCDNEDDQKRWLEVAVVGKLETGELRAAMVAGGAKKGRKSKPIADGEGKAPRMVPAEQLPNDPLRAQSSECGGGGGGAVLPSDDDAFITCPKCGHEFKLGEFKIGGENNGKSTHGTIAGS